MQNGVTATIHIELMADGNIRCGANVPNQFMLNGMMETAKAILNTQIMEQARQKVIVPEPLPPGVNLRN